MACKQGIRESIEKSKENSRREKQYDPYKELWTYLVKKVHSESEGFETLTEAERLFFAVGVFRGEVYNGGIDQFFTNSSGEYYREVVKGLEVLGATKTLWLLRRGTKMLFGDLDPPVDRVERYNARDESNQVLAELNKIDLEFYKNEEGVDVLLNDYANKTGLINKFIV